MNGRPPAPAAHPTTADAEPAHQLPVTAEQIAWAGCELTADDVRDIREATAGDPGLEQLLRHGLTHWAAS